MTDKNKLISDTYNEFSGSIKNTYLDAKKKDSTLKYDDVKKWFEKAFVRKTNLK